MRRMHSCKILLSSQATVDEQGADLRSNLLKKFILNSDDGFKTTRETGKIYGGKKTHGNKRNCRCEYVCCMFDLHHN